MDTTSLIEPIFHATDAMQCIVSNDGTIAMRNQGFGAHFDQASLLESALCEAWGIAHKPMRQFLDAVLTQGTGLLSATIKKKHVLVVGTRFTQEKTPFVHLTIIPQNLQDEAHKKQKKELQIQQQIKHSSMGEMISNIAHQWRQPLNILALIFQDTYIKFQLGGLTSEIMERNYSKSNNLLQYMSQTIDDFRTFFRNDDMSAFEISAVMQGVQEIIGSRFLEHHVAFELNIIEDAQVFGTENGVKQVLINLLNNALEAILLRQIAHGWIHTTISATADTVTIVVEDNGGGIPEEIMQKIFDPYFTTKHQSQGTGLGLYMSKQIIEFNMDGTLEAENRENGARFTIVLPRYKEGA